MTDFFADLLDNEAPIAREITRGDKIKVVHFRRLTAGERMKLVSGQRMTFGDGKRGTMEMDLGDVSKNRHQLVAFCVVTEEGRQVFKDVREVQSQPEWLVTQLAEIADEINKDDEPAGKS